MPVLPVLCTPCFANYALKTIKVLSICYRKFGISRKYRSHVVLFFCLFSFVSVNMYFLILPNVILWYIKFYLNKSFIRNEIINSSSILRHLALFSDFHRESLQNDQVLFPWGWILRKEFQSGMARSDVEIPGSPDTDWELWDSSSKQQREGDGLGPCQP